MLSLFGTEPGAFDCESGTIGAVLGSHGAAALQASCAREQLESALASRDVIGQGKGILMGRFTVLAWFFGRGRKLSTNTSGCRPPTTGATSDAASAG